jgi:hypothetical protein
MYTEKDLYDGMILLWNSGDEYTDSTAYKWNKELQTVSSNRGKSSPCQGYPASKILENLNKGFCKIEIQEIIPLIFN